MKRTEEYLDVNEQKVKVELFEPDGEVKNQAVLFLHGWTGKPNTNAAILLAEQGYTSLTVIFRGHPGSDGDMSKISRQDALEDAIVAYDYLLSKIPMSMPICVVGNSYGGYTSPVLSAERNLNTISMRVPANYPDAGFDLPQAGKGHEDPEIAAWRNAPHDYNATRSLRALHTFKGSIQIIEAEFDDMVPHQTIQNYVDAVADTSKLEYHLMKGWPHSLGNHQRRNKEYQQILLNWLKNL